jgi:hypothetical protein
MTDHLGAAMCDLSLGQKLKKIYVEGYAAASSLLFRAMNNNVRLLVWANLDCVEVEFDMKTPEGTWYFMPGEVKKDEGEVSEDEMKVVEIVITNHTNPRVRNDREKLILVRMGGSLSRPLATFQTEQNFVHSYLLQQKQLYIYENFGICP